jgi:hypothetical protein
MSYQNFHYSAREYAPGLSEAQAERFQVSHLAPQIPKNWARSCCVDFGRKNFYVLFIAHDERTDRHYVYASYHDSHLSNPERARELVALEPLLGFCVAGQISEDHERAELAAGGLKAVAPMFKALWTGINNLAAAIKLNKFYVLDGACPGLVEQLRTYSRPVNELGEVELDADPEDKETYHWIDPARYYGTHKFAALSTGSAEVGAPPEQNKSVGNTNTQGTAAASGSYGGTFGGNPFGSSGGTGGFLDVPGSGFLM